MDHVGGGIRKLPKLALMKEFRASGDGNHMVVARLLRFLARCSSSWRHGSCFWGCFLRVWLADNIGHIDLLTTLFSLFLNGLSHAYLVVSPRNFFFCSSFSAIS